MKNSHTYHHSLKTSLLKCTKNYLMIN